MDYGEISEVSEFAAASDGGSLWIGVTASGRITGFTLVRSIASRGTPAFGCVRADDGRSLDAYSTKQLCRRLRELANTNLACTDLIAEFVRIAEKHAV